MKPRIVLPRIILLLLLVVLCVDQLSADDGTHVDLVENHEFEVDISGLSVSITCPDKVKTLTGGGYDSKDTEEHKLEKYSGDKNGMYTCGSHYLYLHAYVCETCVDVPYTMVAYVVVADCLITIGVCLFVYKFCKKKPGQPRESGFGKGAHNKGNKERPPPVPNPDYEPIKKKRQDLYDGLHQTVK